MTELDFYKWVKSHDPEYRWATNETSKKEDVIIWISVYALESFLKMLPYASLFDEGGIEVRLQKEGIAIWASDILDPFGIELEKIFEKEQ